MLLGLLALADLENVVLASFCTLKPKEERTASCVHKDLTPISLPRLAYVTVAQALGRGREKGGHNLPLKS